VTYLTGARYTPALEDGVRHDDPRWPSRGPAAHRAVGQGPRVAPAGGIRAGHQGADGTHYHGTGSRRDHRRSGAARREADGRPIRMGMVGAGSWVAASSTRW
jgi:hypothetical protein